MHAAEAGFVEVAAVPAGRPQGAREKWPAHPIARIQTMQELHLQQFRSLSI